MPYVRVNDIQMYYELEGEGEPLALIVGLGTDISEWDVIIRWLANKYQVLAFDNRGAGRTDKPDIPYSIEMMAEDTAGLMQALGMKQARVLGISMGGRIALTLALRYPERVKKLVLVSTSARSIKNWRRHFYGILSVCWLLSTSVLKKTSRYKLFLSSRPSSSSMQRKRNARKKYGLAQYLG